MFRYRFFGEIKTMRAFLLATIVTIVLAVAASYVLESIQKPTELANATPSVRIDRE
jgi:hypothetical protein